MLRTISFAAVMLLGVATPPVQGQTKLAWKFQKGDRFLVETVVRQKERITAQGKTIPQESTLTTRTAFLVKEASAEKTLLEQKTESVAYRSNTGGDLAGFDSRLADKMKGAAFTLTLDPAGQVVGLEGYPAFVKKLAESNEDVEKLIRALISEESLRRNAADVFSLLPAGPVKLGDTWQRAWLLPMGPLGSFKCLTNYELAEFANDRAVITFQEEMTHAPQADASPLFKISKLDVKADKAGGRYVFDVAKGRLSEGERTVILGAMVTAEVAKKTLSMRMDVEQATKIRVLEVKRHEGWSVGINGSGNTVGRLPK